MTMNFFFKKRFVGFAPGSEGLKIRFLNSGRSVHDSALLYRLRDSNAFIRGKLAVERFHCRLSRRRPRLISHAARNRARRSHIRPCRGNKSVL